MLSITGKLLSCIEKFCSYLYLFLLLTVELLLRYHYFQNNFILGFDYIRYSNSIFIDNYEEKALLNSYPEQP